MTTDRGSGRGDLALHAAADPDEVRLAFIALGLLVEPGNRDLGRIVARIGPVPALYALLMARGGASTVDLPAIPDRLRARVAARLAEGDPYALAIAAVRKAEHLAVRILTPDDDEWPPRLRDVTRLSRDVADPIQRDTY